jgi:arabinogalactan endo-1,4-beta-galactosidase
MSFENNSLITGADLSLLKRNMDLGAEYSSGGQPVEPVSFFRECGFDWARLRLFHTPTGHGAQCTDLPYTLALATQLKQAGFKLLLDIHYSDTWADPGKQYTPAAWAAMDFQTLEKTVYTYTCEVVTEFIKAGAEPNMVQVGNEITPGMLWEHGRVARAHDTNTVHWQQEESSNHKDAWERFGKLLKAGIQGVHDATGKPTEIMIHIDRGGDIPTNRWFFDKLIEQGVSFDAIGQSYYPFWHGMPEDLADTLDFLGIEYGKDLYLAEVAYPYKHHEMYENALSGDQEGWERLTGKYPLSPEGQKHFMQDVIDIVAASSHGKGIFYWAPEWIPVNGFEDEADAAPCWARALFDKKGNALPALSVFTQSPDPVSV